MFARACVCAFVCALPCMCRSLCIDVRCVHVNVCVCVCVCVCVSMHVRAHVRAEAPYPIRHTAPLLKAQWRMENFFTNGTLEASRSVGCFMVLGS